MKILFLSLDRDLLGNNKDCGVVKRHLFYLNSLNQQTIIVYSPEKYRKQDKLWHEKLSVNASGGRNALSAFIKMYVIGKKILQQEKYDVVVAQDPFLTGLIGYWLKKKFHLGLNLQLHGDFLNNKYWLKKNLLNYVLYHLMKFLLYRSDSIRVVSKRIADSLNKIKINHDKITVVPIHVCWQKFNQTPPRFNLKDRYPGKFIILSVGRLAREKNLPLLIQSFKKVNNEFNNTILIIVGDGPKRNQLKKLVSHLNLTDKVFFPGWQKDLVSFYKTADLFIVSSSSEGYNRTVIEAMACKLPVIMTDVGLAGEAIKNEVNGLIVKVNNTTDLTNAIIKLVSNNTLCQRLSEQGFKTVQSLLSEEENFQLQFACWQKAAGGRF